MSAQFLIREPEQVGPNVCVVDHLDPPDVDSLWLPIAKPCWICENPTCWVELNFESHICPGQCTREAWRQYWEATREIEERYGPLTEFQYPE